jgi:hypothetical protein
MARSTEPVQKSHGTDRFKTGGGERCQVPCRQPPAVSAHDGGKLGTVSTGKLSFVTT